MEEKKSIKDLNFTDLNISELSGKRLNSETIYLESNLKYGIKVRLGRGKSPGNYLIFNFNISKHGIIEYMDQLLDDLPDMHPGSIQLSPNRSYVYDKDKRSSYNYTDSFIYKNAKRKICRKRNREVFRHKEYIHVEYSIPFLFDLELNTLFIKVMELRYVMNSLLSYYKSLDKINNFSKSTIPRVNDDLIPHFSISQSLNDFIEIDRSIDNKVNNLDNKVNNLDNESNNNNNNDPFNI